VDEVARQLLRALRGSRSQVAFSRRLGYRSNVAADWEAGRRAPTAGETLRAAARVGVDVPAALRAFQPLDPLPWSPDDPEEVAAWLRALQGTASQLDVARRTGASRHQVGRWLSGRARPKLPELLRLVDALTGRLSDLVAALVPIEQVPALAAAHARRRAARRLAFDVPWSAAVLTLLETPAAAVPDPVPWLARCLGVDEGEAAVALGALVDAGVVVRERDRWVVVQPLTVDVHATDADVRALKRHWTGVARDRLDRAAPGDLHAFNLFAVSTADLDRIRDLHRAFFREVRAIVAASAPSEAVGLLVTEVVVFGPGSQPLPDHGRRT
jgi:transcriptional regulator with XRE-family HTH domain